MSVCVSKEDLSVNCLLTLYLLDKSDSRVHDKLTLMKATFLAQKCMEEQGVNGFVYEFFRYLYGPFSPEVYDTKDALIESGLINSRGYKLTDRGNEVLEGFRNVIEANAEVFNCIDTAIKEIKGKNVHALLDYVYSLEMTPAGGETKQKIGDMSEFTAILRSDNFSSMKIDESELATLEVYLDKDLYDSVRRGVDDAKKGNLYRLEDVFD